MNISREISDLLVEEKIIDVEETDVYTYCINAVFDIIGTILITVTLGIILNKMMETTLFLLIVIPLRSFSGGYHAKTSQGCLVLSMLYYLASIYLADYLLKNSHFILTIIVFFISLCIVYIISPIESVNKPITIEERQQMLKYTHITLAMILVLSIILNIFSLKLLFKEVCLIIFIHLVFQIIEKIRLVNRSCH